MTQSGLKLRTRISDDNKLTLWLEEVAVPQPGPDEVVVRVDAAPINPSDLGLLFGPADMSTAQQSGTAELPVITAEIPAGRLGMVQARIGQALAAGNEGAGEVIAAGSSPAAQALLGKTVGVIGGEMYAQYRCANVAACLPLHEGTSAVEAASCFVNPMTALGMVETLRREGHTALVHTAAASNLGQMLNRLCQSEGIPLVNVVRKPEQAQLLKSQGAQYVVDSSAEDFKAQLKAALAATDASLVFDAIGGGALVSDILATMEAVASSKMTEYSRYGSTTLKQAYIYGALDTSPTVLKRNFGFAFSVGGWLLTPTLQKLGAARVEELKARVAAEIKTTFASHYNQQVSLAGALSLEAISAYNKRATGEKFLILPQS
jgi:NADPH:quinone reductase-like Zn-dependent oxidoreductase